MASVIREDRFYRRGLILGLTMAEIMILIVFLLLLLLSIFLQRKENEISKLEDQFVEKEETFQELQEKYDQLRERFGDNNFDDLFSELILARKGSDKLKAHVAALEEKVERIEETNEELVKKIEIYRDIKALVRESGVTAEELRQVLREAERQESLVAMLAENGFPVEDSEALKRRLADANAALEAVSKRGDENATLKERLEYFKRWGGRSNQMPPCWIHPVSKKSEYIFDIALTSSGLKVYDRKLKHRREDQAKLPVQNITFLARVPPKRFQDETLPLFEWSKANECRFYVRVFDQTGRTEKLIYKRHLEAVEGHFYKLEVKDPGIRPGERP